MSIRLSYLDIFDWQGENFEEGLFIVSFLVVGGALPFVYLSQPLHFDEAIYLVVAQEVVAGETLYVDVIDHKPPGIFAVAIVATEFIAHPHRVLRLLTYGTTAVSGLLVFHLGRTMVDRSTGMVASILFLLATYLPHFDGFFFLTEPWAVLAMVTAAVLLFEDRTAADIGVGFALGIGVLFNQTVFLFGLAIIVFHALKIRYPGFRTRAYLLETVRRFLVIGVGFVLPVALALAVFYAQGTIDELIYYSVYLPVTSYSTPFELYGHLLALVTLLPVWLLAATVFSRICIEYGRGRSVPDGRLFVAVWGGVLSVPGAIAFAGDHKFLMAFPAIAILAALGLRDWYGRLVDRSFSLGELRKQWPSRTTIVTVILLVSAVAAAGANVKYATHVLNEDFADDARTAERIADHVDGPAYSYPPQSFLFYSSQIEPAVRWVGQPYAEPHVDMIIADLTRRDVQYVIVPALYVSDGAVVEKGYWADTKRPLVAYLNRHYEPVAEVDGHVVFERDEA